MPKLKRIRTDEPGRRKAATATAPSTSGVGSKQPNSDLPPPVPDKLYKRGCEQRCSICRDTGHNRAKCPNKPAQTESSSTKRKCRGGRAFYREDPPRPTQPTQAAGGRGGPTQAARGRGGPTQAAGSRGEPTQAVGGRGGPTQAAGGRGGRALNKCTNTPQVGMRVVFEAHTGRTIIHPGTPYEQIHGVSLMSTQQKLRQECQYQQRKRLGE